jgi:hypothetical protein
MKNTQKNLIAIVIGVVILIVLALFIQPQPITPPADMSAGDTSTTTAPTDTTTPATPDLTFAYPNALTTTYIASNTWPPKVTVTQDAYSCTPSGTQIGPNGQTAEKTINGQVYCVTLASEGAAGSTYKTYTYVTMLGADNVNISFTLQFPQCANFTGAKVAACTKEETGFNVDNLVSTIIQSAAPVTQ